MGKYEFPGKLVLNFLRDSHLAIAFERVLWFVENTLKVSIWMINKLNWRNRILARSTNINSFLCVYDDKKSWKNDVDLEKSISLGWNINNDFGIDKS